jgi:hypothetical protein
VNKAKKEKKIKFKKNEPVSVEEIYREAKAALFENQIMDRWVLGVDCDENGNVVVQYSVIEKQSSISKFDDTIKTIKHKLKSRKNLKEIRDEE